MPAPESFFVRRSGSPPLLLRRPVIDRLVRALVPPLSLTVARFVEQRRVRLEVSGGEGAACMFRGGGFPGGGGLHRSTVAGSSFREGSLLQTRLRRILVTESGGLQSSALPLRNPVLFG